MCGFIRYVGILGITELDEIQQMVEKELSFNVKVKKGAQIFKFLLPTMLAIELFSKKRQEFTNSRGVISHRQSQTKEVNMKHLCKCLTIPDICHGHHGRCPCKKILSGVTFSRLFT